MATKVTTGLITDNAITDAKIANVAITGVTASGGDSSTALATTAFVAGEINSLIDAAPGALNTLNELAAAMGDDANFSTTVTNSIATKLPLAGGTLTGALTVTGNIEASGTKTITAQFDSQNYMQIGANSSGGFLKGLNSNVTNFMIRTYGDSFILNNNVGIGYSSPTEKLFVKHGSVNQTIARFTGANNDRGLVIGTAISGSTNDSVITYDAVSTNSVGQHVFKTDGSERVRIDSSGNVQIVGGNQMTQGLFFYNGGSNHLLSGIRNKSNSSYNDSGGLEFLTSGTSNAAESVKMSIDTQGRVGIGETTPLASLHIKQGDSGLSSINAAADHIFLEDTGANGPGITFASGTTSNCTLAFGDSDSNYQGYILYDNSADTLKIGTGGTGEKLSINSNGYVILNHAASEYGLELRSTGTRSGLVLATPNSGNTIKGSALLLADDTFRLGTQSVYNIHMYQSGYVTKPNQAYARMTASNDQSINSWTKITFDSPAGTSSSSWSTTNNRFTIPISGRYLVDTRVRYATGVTYNYTGIYINGSPFNYNSGSQTSWGNDTTIGGAQIIDLNQNDYIELWAYSPTTVSISGGSTRKYMQVWLLG